MPAPRAESWIVHLRRRTTSGDWLPEIDGLRFIAILAVLLFHMQGQLEHHYALALRPPSTWFTRAFDFGNRGVPLFFVISAFILALPFARHHLLAAPAPSLRKYFLRRLTRIEPPYLVNLATVAAGAALADHISWRALLPHLAASAVYLHYAIYREPSTINAVAWSLEVEVQFYLLAPLLSMVFALRRALLRRAVLIAAMVASTLLQIAAGLSPFTLAGDLQYFLAGLLLADLYLTSISGGARARRWDLISLIGWPVFFFCGETLAGLWLPMLALLLCVAALRGVLTSSVLRTPWIAITGGMCYTIYLWHAPVLTLVGRALGRIPLFTPANYALIFALQGAVKIAAVALVCLPLFVLVERPCMDPKWPQKFAARLRAIFAPAARVAENPNS